MINIDQDLQHWINMVRLITLAGVRTEAESAERNAYLAKIAEKCGSERADRVLSGALHSASSW
jgi:hypothetical protein